MLLTRLRGKGGQAACSRAWYTATSSPRAVLIRPTPAPLSAIRHASTDQTPPLRPPPLRESTVSTSFSAMRDADTAAPPRKSSSVKYLLGLLFFVAMAATSASAYIYYDSFMTWPSELRDDLRKAIRAKTQGNMIRAATHFRRALEIAHTLPQERLGDDALLKVTGISISLGDVLETQGELRQAYDAYADALATTKQQASAPEERLRAVALAQRCGDLASIKEVRDSFSLDLLRAPSAEQHMSWSVEELLRLAVPEQTRQRILQCDQEAINLADLELPKWVSTTTLGASLEALGQVYAKEGKASYAVPLYVQAINLLMPPPPAGELKRATQPTVADRCRVGILMNNVAQLMVDSTEHDGGKPASSKVDDAQAWAMRGLNIVAFAMRGTGWDQKGGQGFKQVQHASDERTAHVKATCCAAEVALLLNMGELSRMRKDSCKAREFYQKAYVRADAYGMREARSMAAGALADLERFPKQK